MFEQNTWWWNVNIGRNWKTLCVSFYFSIIISIFFIFIIKQKKKKKIHSIYIYIFHSEPMKYTPIIREKFYNIEMLDIKINNVSLGFHSKIYNTK